ncbi:MAG: response regulator transcription factor [Tepidisphaeraceae bacterium]
MERVLVVEDHRHLADSMADGLRDQGYGVDVAYTGQEALHHGRSTPYDIILLDLMIPAPDGITVLKRLRDSGMKTPVLCLTALDAISDKVRGLDAGADDYLAKPFEWMELLARVRVLIRRGHGLTHGAIEIADMKIDTLNKSVSRGGEAIALTAKEYALLEFLAYRRNRVMTRSEIWEHLYDREETAGSNVVDVYVGYLRNKIDRGHDLKLLHTRRGMGYVLTDKP